MTDRNSLMVGCVDGCGAVLQARDQQHAEQQNWTRHGNGWRCLSCKGELDRLNRYREAMGRAYGNRV